MDAGEDDFAEEVRAPVPVVVDLWAPWCGPCRMVSPALEALARSHAGRVKLVKVDVDRAPGVAARFEVMGIPILMGRGFTDRDNETGTKVVVINETAARKYFLNESPIGQHFGSSIETTSQLEIVGILRDAKYDSVRSRSAFPASCIWRASSSHAATSEGPT